MRVSNDDIVDVVLKQFEDLPGKGKPLHRGGGVWEWIPLSGIVAEGWFEKATRRLRCDSKADWLQLGRHGLVCLAVA